MLDVSEISGFTPGPWYIGDINTNPDDGVVGEVAICVKTNGTPQGFVAPAVALPFGNHSPGQAMAMANARLIAAAPDMHAEIGRLRREKDELSQGLAELERRVDASYAASEVGDLRAFTPGPWEWQGRDLVSRSARQTLLKGVDFYNGLPDDRLLLAAAPDMHAEIGRLNELLRGVGANRYWEGRWRDEAAENARLRRENAELMEAIKTIASLDNEDLYHGHVDGKPTNTATQLALAALRSATETKDGQ